MHDSIPKLIYKIARDAQTLNEVLANLPATKTKTEILSLSVDENSINRRMTKWSIILSGLQSQGLLDKRLKAAGVDYDAVRLALGESYTLPEELPQWCDVLEQLLRWIPKRNANEYKDHPEREELPFSEILSSIADFGIARLKTEIDSARITIMDNAWNDLRKDLAQSILVISESVLEYEFALYCAKFRRSKHILASNRSNMIYKQFVADFFCKGLYRWADSYPVWARLISVKIMHWFDFAKELLVRLAEDREELHQIFKIPKTTMLQGLKAGLSDGHSCGRYVVSLTFSEGHRVVYKPRNCGAEEQFSKLISFANTNLGVSLYPMRVVNRVHYGWNEFIEHTPCTSSRDFAMFYERMGQLMFLVYMLRGTDLHEENIIAMGSTPVAVDLETLMHPCPAEMRINNKTQFSPIADDAIKKTNFETSVLSTCLLPEWLIGQDGIIGDISGIGADLTQFSSKKSLTWCDLHTDRIRRCLSEVSASPVQNKPFVDDKCFASSLHYTKSLINGFRNTYMQSLDIKENLADKLMNLFSNVQTRLLIRNTTTYGALLKRSAHVDFLKSGIDRSIEFELLAGIFRTVMDDQMTKHDWIIEQEQFNLERFDIPRFAMNHNSCDVWCDDETNRIADFSIVSPREILADQIKHLSYEDIKIQCGYIDSSLCAISADSVHSYQTVTSAKKTSSTPVSLENTLSIDEIHNEAIRLAGHLLGTACETSSGWTSWLGLEYLPHAERYQFQPAAEDLYSGVPGILLSLAKVSRLCNDDRILTFINRAIQPIRKLVCEMPDLLCDVLGGSAFVGFAGTAYSFVHICNLTGVCNIPQGFYRQSAEILSRWISTTKESDLMLGIAGVVLTCIHFYEISGDTMCLKIATEGGHLLIDKLQSVDGRLKSWTSGGRFLAGLSHGASGIALSLMRLYYITKHSGFLVAAGEGLAYEKWLRHDAGDMDWPKLTDEYDKSSRKHFMNAWCHGAAGIGIARKAILDIVQDDSDLQKLMLDDLRAAINLTSNWEPTGLDHICCGNAGRSLAIRLMNYGVKNHMPDTICRRHISYAINRARLRGSYSLFWNLPPNQSNPGLMQGIAGLVYAAAVISEGKYTSPNILTLS